MFECHDYFHVNVARFNELANNVDSTRLDDDSGKIQSVSTWNRKVHFEIPTENKENIAERQLSTESSLFLQENLRDSLRFRNKNIDVQNVASHRAPMEISPVSQMTPASGSKHGSFAEGAKISRLYRRYTTASSMFNLSRREIERMHRVPLQKAINSFLQQDLSRSRLPFILYKGNAGFSLIFILGVCLIFLGLLPLMLARSQREYRAYYGQTDESFTLSVDQDMPLPLYMYIVIEDFYGNYRDVVTSRSSELLAGYDCGPNDTVGALKEIRPINTIPEVEELNLPDETVLFPCGISAFTLFNDQLRFREMPDGVRFIEKRLAEVERVILFAVQPPDNAVQWISPLDEHFRSWSVMPFSSNFLRLWGTLEGPSGTVLSKGDYVIDVEKNLWPSDTWNSKKGVSLMLLPHFGSRQVPTAVLIISYGMGLVGAAVIFFFLNKHSVLADLPEEGPAGGGDSMIMESHDHTKRSASDRISRSKVFSSDLESYHAKFNSQIEIHVEKKKSEVSDAAASG